jgi:hypothetical protein
MGQSRSTVFLVRIASLPMALHPPPMADCLESVRGGARQSQVDLVLVAPGRTAKRSISAADFSAFYPLSRPKAAFRQNV